MRTIVFLKGCALRCKWCCNPESQNIKKELMFQEMLCNHCGLCKDICPQQALRYEDEVHIDNEKCIACGRCTTQCPTHALTIMGKEVSVEEILYEIRKDDVYYRQSGGGVTLSGGEALLQSEFVLALVSRLKAEGYHVAVETTGIFLNEKVEKVIEKIDLVLFDMKAMSEKLHKEYTGVSNYDILTHLPRYTELAKKVIIRIPLIPDVNDTMENAKRLVYYLKKVVPSIDEIHLLPFHNLGSWKYRALEKEYVFEDKSGNVSKEIEKLKEYFQKEGYKTVIGGYTEK